MPSASPLHDFTMTDTSNRSLLPIVSKETLDTVAAEFIRDSSKQPSVLQQMKRENPTLTDGLSNAIVTLAQGDRTAMENMLTTATILYESLYKQADADARTT